MNSLDVGPQTLAARRLPVRPGVLLLIGYGQIAGGLLLQLLPVDALVPLRVVLLLAGLITAGFALWFRLSRPWQGTTWEGNAGWFVLAAGGTPFAASFGMDPDWDSIILMLNVLTALAIIGAVLVAVSSPLRRTVISVLVVVHFCGIFVATTAIGVPPAPPPWLNTQLWARVYRCYYSFMYLSNAYHFYSPNPGPATLLWFRIEYEDHSYHWVHIPVRQDYATRLAFQRRLGMAEKANIPNTYTGLYPLYQQDRFWQRRVSGQVREIPLEQLYPEAMSQYQEPAPLAKYYLSTFARHAAIAYPSDKDPNLKVIGVKIYKATQALLEPGEFAEGHDPLDPSLYVVVFEGDFTPEGELRPNDGFLYWQLPMVWKPVVQGVAYPVPEDAPTRKDKEGNRQVLVDYVRIHAGDIFRSRTVQ